MKGLEWLVGRLLLCGTWIASAVTACGLAMMFLGGRSGLATVTAGITLFILLPALRVTLMLAVFVYERDFRFSAIAAIVLAIMLTGLAIGGHASAKP